MASERRNDLGGKIVSSALIIVITFVIAQFLTRTARIADGAFVLCNENKTSIAVLSQCLKDIDRRASKWDKEFNSMNTKLDTIINNGRQNK